MSAASSARAAELVGMQAMDYRQQLLPYFLGQRQLRYVGGHFGFSETAHRQFGDEWRFVTVLRHPVARWFSLYFYNRYKESGRARIEVDLDAFANSRAGQSAGQALVRHLTDRSRKPGARFVPSIDEAIANLEKFHLVGCLEHIDVFVRDLERLLGVPLALPTMRPSPVSREKRDSLISDQIRDRVHELCRDDLVLYEHALQKVKISESR